jgi:hypothetical protein
MVALCEVIAGLDSAAAPILPAGKCKDNPAIPGMLQDLRSVHAYHNSTTLIPGYRRILLGISHLTQLNTS